MIQSRQHGSAAFTPLQSASFQAVLICRSRLNDSNTKRRKRRAPMLAVLGTHQACPVHLLCLLLCLFHLRLDAAESWPEALAHMPLGSNVRQLNPSNCVDILLSALESNAVVKALIFMPGATDELYMFRRAKAELRNASPTLLDAVSALTNQTLIRATFRPPMLLLHTDEDPLEPVIDIEQQTVADKLKRARFAAHRVFNDRDWDFVQPILKKTLRTDIRPWQYSYDSWHFYRHSFAAWGLTGWEALEAVALAGKTTVSVRGNTGFRLRRPQVIFQCDPRVRNLPKLDQFPR
jgi:hypothetical protein